MHVRISALDYLWGQSEYIYSWAARPGYQIVYEFSWVPNLFEAGSDVGNP